jgi:hypothetical protein
MPDDAGTLGAFDNYVPIPPDSIADLYSSYDRGKFYATYSEEIAEATRLVDSLDHGLPDSLQIDTLSIGFAIDDFGTAARTGRTLFISCGYFFVYNSPAVIRAVITHEFGHIWYERLTEERKSLVDRVWTTFSRGGALYVFRDGEYSGNAWFGGHPEESPEELFASAFNLFRNRPDELRVRLRYLPEHYYSSVDSLRWCLGMTHLVLFD